MFAGWRSSVVQQTWRMLPAGNEVCQYLIYRMKLSINHALICGSQAVQMFDVAVDLARGLDSDFVQASQRQGKQYGL